MSQLQPSPPSYQPLSAEFFAHKTWQPYTDYRHAAQLHLVPLSAPEVAPAAADLPVVFAPNPQGKFSLCLLTGLAMGQNHCLDQHWQWQTSYVPVFVRNHPFRLLPVPAQPEQYVLCVDTSSPWLQASGGDGQEPFFDATQQVNPRIQDVVKTLQAQIRHQHFTQLAVDALVQHRLLMPWHLHDVQGLPISGLQRINEEALQQLSSEALNALLRTGSLAIAYAQMLSTHQLHRLQKLAQLAGAHTALA